MNIYIEGIFLKGNAPKAGLQYVSSRAVVPVEGPWFLFSSSLPSEQKYLQMLLPLEIASGPQGRLGLSNIPSSLWSPQKHQLDVGSEESGFFLK